MPSRLTRNDEPGQVHFVTMSCYGRLAFFRHDGAKRAFVEAMKCTRAALGVRWIGYVIMPEHVHLVVYCALNGGETVVPISRVLQSVKGASGRLGKQALRAVWARDRSLGTRPLDRWAVGHGAKPFWKTRGYDHNVFREKRVIEKLNYVHKNPIRRGLVDCAEQWRWSSYRYYEFGDSSPIAMDWDGGFPM